MSSGSNYNFRATHFPKETLTRVIGKPNYESLAKCLREVKKNAKSVPTNRGGGQHGYLGVVIDAANYAFVSNQPFDVPVDPGPLQFPQGATQTQQRIMSSIRDDHLRDFESYCAVVRQLKTQIEEAFDEEWLDPLRDPITESLNASIPDIFEHLFRLYGDVNSTTLAEKAEEVRTLVYDPTTNGPDYVYNAIKKLIDYAEAANSPYTQRQIINMGFEIFKKTRRFGDAITEWNRGIHHNPAQMTWMNFKQHFRQAYKELVERNDLVANDTPFNQANLVSEITTALSGRINESVQEQLNMIAPPPIMNPHQNLPPQYPSPFPPQAPPTLLPPAYFQAPPPPTQDVPPQVPQQMNAVTQSDIANIMQNMMQMQQQTIMQMQNMMSNQPTGGEGRGGGRGGGRGRGRGRGRGNQQQQGQQPADQQQQGQQQQGQQLPHQYCWTHGWCKHNGNQCETPAAGHQPNATAFHRMGGSTKNLPNGYL